MSIKPSSRLLAVPSSPIRKLVPYAVEAKKHGVTVYHLNIGDPDIETPRVMLDVLKGWTKTVIGYGQSQGEPTMLDALVWYYHHIGYKFIKSEHLQVTAGGSEAISMAFFATCAPNDEVIVFEPFYTNYNAYAVLNGVKLKPILTDIKSGFHLPRRQIIESHISPKTRAMLICNPNNPTGTVYTKKEIDMVVEIAKKHNLFILSDEVYREFAYDGNKQVSLLSYMEALPSQVIVLDSLSKRYGLCGARLGCLVSLNADMMAGVLRIAQSRLSSGVVDQAMAAKLTDVPDSYLLSVRKEYEKRRDIVYEGLKAIPGVTSFKPEGAFYTVAGLPVDDADKFCQWLLTDYRDKNETIMLAPAAGFYASKDLGTKEVRIAYVINQESLKRAMNILGKALRIYPNRARAQ